MDDFSLLSFPKTTQKVTLTEGYTDLDLNHRAIQNSAATHLFQVEESHIENVLPGDLLVVNCSIHPRPGDVLKVDIEGEYQIRRLIRNAGKLFLVTDDNAIPPYPTDETGGFCCGVVTGLYRSSV